jgi:hypothetical protein
LFNSFGEGFANGWCPFQGLTMGLLQENQSTSV